MAFIIFLTWIQNRITQSYLRKIRKAELDSLHQELREKDSIIAALQANNDSLAQIIHKDNKILPAMEESILHYLESSAEMSAEERQHLGTSLSDNLQSMLQKRRASLTEYQRQGNTIPISGITSVDAVLAYMYNQASEHHIDFSVKLSGNLSDIIKESIPEEDLSHLLADLIENSMIATGEQNHNSPRIHVHIGQALNKLILEISDSGIPFAIEVLQDFGLQKHTTHETTGGSGIGLMDIWQIKKKYHASLHIHEYDPSSGDTPEHFTKKLVLLFDEKGHYLVQTYRHQEILMKQARSDLYVLPPQQ